MPRFLGQHFLKNHGVVLSIIKAVDPRAGDTIIEVGPGHGELTFPLAAAAARTGAKIVAVEKDQRLAEALRAKIAAEEIANLEVVTADVLTFLKQAAISKTYQKIAGNIPYYLTGHLLRRIGEMPALTRAVLMVQKEVANRICAEPPHMNRLAASIQFWADSKVIARVPREDFSPPPEVDSAVVELRAREGQGAVEREVYYRAVRTLFAQPRKTIFNNLSAGFAGEKKAIYSREAVAKGLASLNLDPNLRPQDLSLEKIIEIAKEFSA